MTLSLSCKAGLCRGCSPGGFSAASTAGILEIPESPKSRFKNPPLRFFALEFFVCPFSPENQFHALARVKRMVSAATIKAMVVKDASHRHRQQDGGIPSLACA
jgi:hypothetical protein